MDDIEAQRDELTALASIFDESQIQIDSICQTAGCIYVKPEILDDLTVLIDPQIDSKATKFDLRHVCPIELHFNLPTYYPSSFPPHFSLVCKWLKRDQVIPMQ